MRNVRPSQAVIEARKREIAQRYRTQAKRKGRHRQPLTLAAVRIAELTRLFDDRHGPVLLPADECGDLGARIMVHHLATLRDPQPRIRDWLATCTPWLGLASRERLIRDALEHPIRWRADKLGWKLKVTAAERERLDLRTIGCFDLSREERVERAKAKRSARLRAYRERQRRAAGAMPRTEYEAAAASRSKPWEAAGLSRAAWYRARKP